MRMRFVSSVVNLRRAVRRTLNGRRYVVAPVTLIVSGTLAGSRGPLYYPPDELKESADSWNGMPLVLDHPVNNGMYLSGRDPQVIEKYGLGSVFNVRWQESRQALRGEAWFDEVACAKNAPGLIDQIDKGRRIEVSTGLGTRNYRAENDARDPKGRPYSHVAREYKPDHLAVLVDKPGACSVSDGCGVNNSPPAHDQDEDIGEYTQNWCNQYGGDTCKLRTTHKRKLKQSGKTAPLGAKDDPVKDKTTGKTYTGQGFFGFAKSKPKSVTNSQERPMKRSQAIKYLTTNCACWKGQGAAEVLNGLSSEQLLDLYKTAKDREVLSGVVANARQKLGLDDDADLVEAIPTPAPTTDNGCSEPDGDEGMGGKKKGKKKGGDMAMNEWLESMPAEARAVWNTAVQVEKRERAALVEKIVNSLPQAQQKSARAYWGGKSVEDLLQRASEVPTTNSAARNDPEDRVDTGSQPLLRGRVPNFFGASGGPVVNEDGNVDDDAPLLMPTVNYAELAVGVGAARRN